MIKIKRDVANGIYCSTIINYNRSHCCLLIFTCIVKLYVMLS